MYLFKKQNTKCYKKNQSKKRRSFLSQDKHCNRWRTSVSFVQSLRSSETQFTYQWMTILSGSMPLKRARLMLYKTFYFTRIIFIGTKNFKVMQFRSFSGIFSFDNDKVQGVWWRIRWILKIELLWSSCVLFRQIFITLNTLTKKKYRYFSMKLNFRSNCGCLNRIVQNRNICPINL